MYQKFLKVINQLGRRKIAVGKLLPPFKTDLLKISLIVIEISKNGYNGSINKIRTLLTWQSR